MLKECEEALQNHDGDIVEIGAGLGETTKLLLELAAKYDRKVYVIDPFESGWKDMPHDYGRPYTLSGFHANVHNHKDRLVIHQINSLSEKADTICRGISISFAFIDGLQYKGAVLNDLVICDHAHLICVDDMDRVTNDSEVPSAVKDYIRETNKSLIIKDRWALIK